MVCSLASQGASTAWTVLDSRVSKLKTRELCSEGVPARCFALKHFRVRMFQRLGNLEAAASRTQEYLVRNRLELMIHKNNGL